MKKKLLSYIIILLICFVASPAIFYFALSSSEFNSFNLYYDKTVYILLYLKIALFGLLLIVAAKVIDKLLFKILSNMPIKKSKLISIEKINIASLDINLPSETSASFEEIYSIKFKHNNKIIDLTISKDNLKNDLNKEDCPYVEYQYVNLIIFFNKFLNIKVHTKDKH